MMERCFRMEVKDSGKYYYCIIDLTYDLSQAGIEISEEVIERYRNLFSESINTLMGADVVLVSRAESSYYADRGYEEVPNSIWKQAHNMIP